MRGMRGSLFIEVVVKWVFTVHMFLSTIKHKVVAHSATKNLKILQTDKMSLEGI